MQAASRGSGAHGMQTHCLQLNGLWEMSDWLTDAWLGLLPKYVFNADKA